MGVDQERLGTSGGLSGTARYAGGTIAQAVYLAVFSKDLVKGIARLVPPAAIAAGLPEADLPALMKVITSPSLAKNYSPAVAEAVFSAYQEATRHSIQ
jgi:hypothetical protein